MPNSNTSALSFFSCSLTTPTNTAALQISDVVKKEVNLLSGANSINFFDDIYPRKSCEFSHHSSSCIKKAAYNLSKIEERLNEWYDCVLPSTELNGTLPSTELKDSSASTELKDSLTSSELDVISSAELKKLKINKKHEENLKIKDYDHPLQNISSGSLLKICGFDLNADSSDLNNNSERSAVQNISPKSMLMIKGVSNLLERLEIDRLNTVKLLEKECERTSKLKDLLDAEAYKRIHELPRRVQEEHDNCICDIRELKWHFEYQSRLEANACEVLEKATNHQETLLNEVNYIKVNNPLLLEKLDLEDEAMKVVKLKQEQVDCDVSAAEAEMKQVRLEFEKVKLKADNEQRMMSEKVSALSGELNKNLNLFLNAQNEHLKMKERKTELKNKIDEDNCKRSSGEKHLDNLNEIGLFLQEKVEMCKMNIIEQEKLYDTLLQSDLDYQQQKLEENSKLTKMRKELESTLSLNAKEIRRMIMLNKKTKKEIHLVKRKVEDSEKTRKSNEKAVKRAISELEIVQEELTLIKAQALDLKNLQETLQLKLEQENLKAAEEEEKLTEQSTTLQKQNREESHARKTLLARIKAETASFEYKKSESETKKQKMLQAYEDLLRVIGNIEDQMASLSVKYEERMRAIEGLNKLLSQVADKSSYFKESSSSEINVLEGKEKALKINISEVCAIQDYMDVTTANLNKKLGDMESSTIMMNKFLSGNKTAIEDLQEEITELQMQLETANKLDEKLRKSLADVNQRASCQQQKHFKLMNSLHQKFDGLKNMLEDGLLENDRLATKYLNLQSKHINEKNDFVNNFEKHMIALGSLRDKESLCELHSRLHEALKCYYQLRSIQTKAGLSRFENMTKMTYVRLRRIQENLEKCTHNVSVFLRATNRYQSIAGLTMALNSRKVLPYVPEEPNSSNSSLKSSKL